MVSESGDAPGSWGRVQGMGGERVAGDGSLDRQLRCNSRPPRACVKGGRGQAERHGSYETGGIVMADGDGGGGWLVWLLALGGVNLCSYLFDWSFWIY